MYSVVYLDMNAWLLGQHEAFEARGKRLFDQVALLLLVLG
jgi:hypothetical protein